MKLIIDIDEADYKTLSNMSEKEKVNELSYYDRVIANGTPISTEGDLISRSELKKAIENYLEKRQDVIIWETDMLNMLDNAPTVAVNCKDCDGYEAGYSAGLKDAERPQSKWIPVSERLPEINVDVIVTDIETTGTYSAYYLGDGFWECDNGTHNNRIIAWMPFPEPHKKEGTE